MTEVSMRFYYHAPAFGTNLVSDMAPMSKGLSILLAEPTCQVLQYDHAMLAEGERIGGLIRLSTFIPLSQTKEAIAHYTRAQISSRSDFVASRIGVDKDQN